MIKKYILPCTVLFLFVSLYISSVYAFHPPPSAGTVLSVHGILPHYPPDTTFNYIATDTNAPYPGYLSPTFGTLFSNKIIRISDYPAVPINYPYPKTPSWNSDGSLLMLTTRLVDGSTYQTIAANAWWDDDEKKWSAGLPNIYYAMEHNRDLNGDGTNDHAFVKRDVTPVLEGGTVPAKDIMISFSGSLYDQVLLGKYEGNIDHHDRYVAFAARLKGADYLTAIVYNIRTGQITTETNMTHILWEDAGGGQILDWISVSPSGKYILINWKKDPGNPNADYRYSIDQYDINMNFIRELSDQGQHGDIGINADRSDVYVQFGFGSKRGIWAYDLDTGTERKLLPDKYNGGHVSCRNYDRPGWCYLSTNSEGYHEVFALKTDGSGTVNRFAQTHTSGHDSEGGVNPLGTKMLFQSDWNGASSNNTREAFIVETVD